MLRQIQEFFAANIASTANGSPATERSVALATTALLVEMMRIDKESLGVERGALITAIRRQFDLSESDADALTEMADAQLREATDYYQFTSLINDQFSQFQKLQVLESLWLVAYADEQISAHERHLMRKLADLLYVPHGDHMLAKDRARHKAGM